ncbi:MAG: hypothetical protein R2684_00945 [Pyrinomonadaceae bacterium]
MKFHSIFTLAIAALLLNTLFVSEAFGCACCAERGDYIESTSPFDSFIRDELSYLRTETADLFSDAGYPDNIIGISPVDDKYSINAFLQGGNWNFTVKDGSARTGTLRLTSPKKYVSFMVDQNPASEAIEPTLYKELRIEGSVLSSNGVFSTVGKKGVKYKLVLQGKGNRCLSANDFKTYIFRVSGSKADFTYFGKLGMKDAEAMQQPIDSAGTGIVSRPPAT